MRLGVVEDHARVRESLVELFEAYGFEVVGSCANGHEAVAFCLDAEPDAIVMDLSMPDVDGWAAMGELQAAEAHAHGGAPAVGSTLSS